MIERLDHVVIAVPDLDAAMRDYAALGFDVRAGGGHSGRGTHNALIEFGAGYLELLSVQDPARATAPSQAALAAFTREQGGGLIGYALGTTDIEATAAQLEREGLAADGPFAMSRMRTDGREIGWRLLVPGGLSWQRPWPFFIQWDEAADRPGRAAGEHANGVQGVREIAVVVEDLEQGIDLYGRQLGLPLVAREEIVAWRALRATFECGGVSIHVCAPNAPGLVAGMLAVRGEGIWQLILGVRSLADSQSWLERQGVVLLPATGVVDGALIPPERAVGARLVLREDS